MATSVFAFAVLVLIANRFGLYTAAKADESTSYRHGAARWLLISVPLSCLTTIAVLSDYLDKYSFGIKPSSLVVDSVQGAMVGLGVGAIVYVITYYFVRTTS